MDRKGQFLPLRDENPLTIVPFVNWAIIAVNILIFLISLTSLDYFISTFGFVPSSFSVVTIFTSMFLHGSLAHIAGNMWFLYIFGDNVEERLGHGYYLLFYLCAGIAATLAHLLLNMGSSVPAVGASGAISGVLGAYMIFFPDAGVYVSGGAGHGKMSAKLMIGLWFVFQFISGVGSLFGSGAGIAFWAHIGGFIAGAGMALLIGRTVKEKQKRRI